MNTWYCRGNVISMQRLSQVIGLYVSIVIGYRGVEEIIYPGARDAPFGV